MVNPADTCSSLSVYDDVHNLKDDLQAYAAEGLLTCQERSNIPINLIGMIAIAILFPAALLECKNIDEMWNLIKPTKVSS